MAGLESVKLSTDTMDVVRTIAKQTGRSLHEVITMALLRYSEVYLEGYSAGGRIFSRALGESKSKG